MDALIAPPPIPPTSAAVASALVVSFPTPKSGASNFTPTYKTPPQNNPCANEPATPAVTGLVNPNVALPLATCPTPLVRLNGVFVRTGVAEFTVVAAPSAKPYAS